MSRKRITTARIPIEPSRLRTFGYAPLIVVLAALGIRLIVLAQLGGHPLLQPAGVLDDAVHVQLATRVASGDLLLAPDVYFLSPFYTYFLGLVIALTGGSLAAARLVQVLLGTAAVALTMGTATLWFGRRAGLITGILAAGVGIFAFNEVLIMQSALDVFLTSLALFTLTHALRSGSWRLFAAAGLALAALALNRPNALPCIAAIAASWIALRRSRLAATQALALVVGASLLLAPVALRNRLVAGETALVTSHGGLNFLIGNHAAADGAWNGIAGISPSIAGQERDTKLVAGKALGRPVSASEASDYFYGQAFQWIRANPGAWLSLMLRKIALTLNRVDLALNYSFTYFAFDERSLLSVLAVGPWLIIPLGLFGLARGINLSGDRSAYLTWLAFVPVYALAVALFFVSSRYRLPLLVPMLVGAGAALQSVWDDLKSRQVRRWLLTLVPMLVLFAFTNWPIRNDDGRMYQRGERIVRWFGEGQSDTAERLLAETEPRYPEPGLLLYRIGLVFRERNEPGKAIDYFQRALSQDPGEPLIQFVLGEVLLEAGRPRDAVQHLEKAGAAGVDPATVAYDLAGAYRMLGMNERARASLASIVVTPEMDGRALLQLGTSALEIQDLPLAVRFLGEAVRRAPSLAGAHAALGSAYATLNRTGDALAELEIARRLDPNDATTCILLAALNAQLNQVADARALAEEALRLRPGLPDAQGLLLQLASKK